MSNAVSFRVEDSSKVGEARRLATALCSQLGFSESAAGKSSIVVTELANNLHKHAGGGEIVLRPIKIDAIDGLVILSLDKGPGMDIGVCLRDGYSTSGSPGTGLGAVSRLASTFDVFSQTGGTALLARMMAQPRPPGRKNAEPELGVLCLPKPQETVCGDAWASHAWPHRSQFLIADGLGHGPLAATAANEAVRILHSQAGRDPVQILDAIHNALRSTRGAAVALADIDFTTQQIRFVGVGNIAATVVDGLTTRSMISHNGIVGHRLHKLQEFVYPFPTGALLVMHSDGLSAQWRIDQYPGLVNRDPSLIAGVLYRDFKRERDDVTVLVARAGDEQAT